MSSTHFLFFRGVLFEILLLQALYQPETAAWSPWLWALLAGYASYALALFMQTRRQPSSRADSPWWFLGDITAITLVLQATQGVSSDFYVAYFLVILASALMQRAAYSFLVGGVCCLVYGSLTLPSWETALAPAHLLRLSLLLTTTFLSALVSEAAHKAQRSLREEYGERMAWLERLSLAGRIAAEVLHEVKTPLNTILIRAERARQLLKRPQPEPQIGESLAAIEEEAERISLILADFLDFTRPAKLSLAPVALRSLVEKACEKITAGIDPGAIRFENRLDPGTMVLASERHLTQVFLNLFDNAIQAMPLGGTLTVSEAWKDGRVEIAVADAGMGIPAHLLERLREPFFTTRSQEGGHGLGLGVTRWIVEKHGGELRIHSPGPKQGTTIFLTLPLKS